MAEKIGSPLEGSAAEQAPSKPLLGDTPATPLSGLSVEPGAPAESAAVSDASNPFLAALKEMEASGMVSQGASVSFEDTQLPWYPDLTVATYLKGWMSRSPAEIIRLQRQLVGAGYARAQNIGTMGDPFDHETQNALQYMLQDALSSGYKPGDILAYRIALADGQKPEDIQSMAESGTVNRKQWERDMATAYVSTWRRPMPEGYLQGKEGMNPDEFEQYERAKVLWQRSGIAREEQDSLARQLTAYFNKPSQAPQAPTAPAPGTLTQTYDEKGNRLATPVALNPITEAK